jgi:hypothetical protein
MGRRRASCPSLMPCKPECQNHGHGGRRAIPSPCRRGRWNAAACRLPPHDPGTPWHAGDALPGAGCQWRRSARRAAMPAARARRDYTAGACTGHIKHKHCVTDGTAKPQSTTIPWRSVTRTMPVAPTLGPAAGSTCARTQCAVSARRRPVTHCHTQCTYSCPPRAACQGCECGGL